MSKEEKQDKMFAENESRKTLAFERILKDLSEKIGYILQILLDSINCYQYHEFRNRLDMDFDVLEDYEYFLKYKHFPITENSKYLNF